MAGASRRLIGKDRHAKASVEFAMARIRGDNHAFGWPGLEPRWTHGDKDGIGTAYSAASRIWFTVWNGIVTQGYYPTVDMPQMRDVQLLFTDGQSFFHQETKYLESRIQRMPSCLGYRVEGTDPEGRYAYVRTEPTRPPACSRRAGGLSPVIRPPENGAICWLRSTKNPPSGDVLSC